MRKHIYKAVNVFGDAFSTCGIGIGTISESDVLSFHKHYASNKKDVTCERCKSTHLFARLK